MLDLADVTGLPIEALSLNGRLGLAVGARGKGRALAHYEPTQQVINLTRKSGVGSLAHEWAHGFDHMLEEFKTKQTEKGIAGSYASDQTMPHRFVKDADTPGGYRRESKGDDPLWQAMDGVRKSWKASGFEERLSTHTAMMIKNGHLAKSAGKYWRSTVEKFARSFERHVQHKLGEGDRSNTYLSGHQGGGLWPNDKEAAHMAPAFDALMDAYREHTLKQPERSKYSAAQRAAYIAQIRLNARVRYAAIADRYGIELTHHG